MSLYANGIATISSSHLVGNFSHGGNTLSDTSVKKTVTYDPPSIAANATISTTVTLSGARVGDTVQAAFNQYIANIEVDAVVSSNNTVTVKFKNTSNAAVDLPSGTLTVKLI